MPTSMDFLRFVRRLAIARGTFYVPYFVSRLANPVNSMSVWNKILQLILAVSTVIVMMFVNMVAKATANAINAKPVAVRSMP